MIYMSLDFRPKSVLSGTGNISEREKLNQEKCIFLIQGGIKTVELIVKSLWLELVTILMQVILSNRMSSPNLYAEMCMVWAW